MESSFKIVEIRTNQAIICRPHINQTLLFQTQHSALTAVAHTIGHSRSQCQLPLATLSNTQPYKVYYDDMFGPQLHLDVRYLHHVPLPVAVTHRCRAFIFASRNLLPPSSGPHTCLCNCYENTKRCDNLLTDFRCQTSTGNNIYKRFKQGTQKHVQEYNIKMELQMLCSDDSGGLLWIR